MIHDSTQHTTYHSSSTRHVEQARGVSGPHVHEHETTVLAFAVRDAQLPHTLRKCLYGSIHIHNKGSV